MNMYKFRSRCVPGTRVCLLRDAACQGVVRKLSADGCRALVAWQGGDVTWANYYVIDFIPDSKDNEK
jgi:hypothetical protein